ncbi:Haloacid Dehalogenase superfamily [Parelusimicrobium proximum]|uniref:HAD-IB family phosphatase n=1 Tax=Parelusimicrobium proximum TaxID=3228953 RepID=UPI003D1759B9
MTKKYAVITDFDGTVTQKDVAHLLVDHYHVHGHDVEPEHKDDDSAKNWMRSYMGGLKISKEEFDNFVLTKAHPRDGLLELIQTCFAKGIPFEIVSGGLDIYILPFLEHYKITGIPVYSANAFFTDDGIKVDYPLIENYSLEEFKAMRVNHYKNLGYTTIFSGDGLTDYMAAATAGTAFATGALLKKCRANNIAARELVTFKEMTDIIK